MKSTLQAFVSVAALGTLLLATSGCGSSGSGGNTASSSSPTPTPTPSTPLTITSVSNTSPTPLTALQIGTAGLDTTSPVAIQFFNSAGFSLTEQPIRVTSGGTIVVATPLFADPVTGQIGPGTVSLSLSQGGHSSGPTTINIQDLPQLSTYGTNLGDITHAVLVLDALLVGRRLGQFQAFQVLPGNKVDTSTAQATMNTLLNATIQARSDVDRVSINHSLVISNGTLSDGSTLQFDQGSLDMMDRVNAVFLTQTFATVLSSIPTPSATNTLARGHKSVGKSSMPPRSHASSKDAGPQSAGSIIQTVIKAIADEKTLTAFEASALQLMNSQNWVDATEAIAGGIGAITDLASKTPNNELLGAAAAIVSDVHVTGHVFGDLAAYATGLVSGNPALVNAAIQDMDAIDRGELYKTLFDLVTTAPRVAEMEVVGAISTTLNLIDIAQQLAQPTQDADTTSLNILNDFQSPFPSNNQGIAIAEGVANVSNTGGISAAQSSLDLCCFGASNLGIIGIADPNGTYDLFVPLQVPGTTYSALTLQIIDPVSGTILGTMTVDLSNLNTSSIFTLPTISGVCNDNDASSPDADDPDCD